MDQCKYHLLIKELCELIKLTGLQLVLNKKDFNRSDQNMIDKLERLRERLTEFTFKIVRISLYFWNLWLFYLEWSKDNDEQFLVFIIFAPFSFRTYKTCS